MKTHRLLGIAVVAASAFAPVVAQAQLGTMSYQYFSVTNNTTLNHDFNRGIDGSIVAGLVNTNLSAGGLPTVSAFGASYAGPSGPIQQVNGSGELQWWTPGANITADGSGTIAVPFSGISSGFFPSVGPGNSNFFRTAIFQGALNLAGPASYNFSLGSDDDAWLFIDGMLVGDNGGVKSGSPTVFNTGSLAMGAHTVDLFFADRHITESGVTFAPEFTVTTTPEPASMSLVATGLVGVFGMARRRRKSSV